ncbi:MAG: SDR family oxidoreductase [Alphaproteobacteria bacterium]|nr:SDR family oxidoreductase [Alphaproteobacteria bacterium]
MELGLKGCNAIVTGGTKGIGRAIALMLAEEGANVSICARTKADVDATVGVLRAKGVKGHGAALDLADADKLKAWIDDTAKALGGIDIVVANASALATENATESWKREFEVDLMGTVNACEHALPHLEKSKSGSIVVISSVSGIEADVVAGPYGATKSALIHYAKGLACRLAPQGIRANTVSPGTTYFKGGIWNWIEDNNPALFKQGLAMNKMGRMATAEEVANAVTFLASPRASFITGTNLLVDGALTNRVA